MKKKLKLKILIKENNFENQLINRLEGGQFRLLNEKMYKNIKLSDDQIKRYHIFYKNQMQKWPIDPNEIILNDILKYIKYLDFKFSNQIIIIKNNKNLQLISGEDQNNIVIGDLGAGNVEKYNNFLKDIKNFHNINIKVEFFDKYPLNKKVIKADIEKIPRDEKIFNIIICCLSLIKNDISNILKEINRLLKINCIFIFAELKSRISNIKKFIKYIERYGFKLEKIDNENKCFIIIKFIKRRDITDQKLPTIKLNNYLYKKR